MTREMTVVLLDALSSKGDTSIAKTLNYAVGGLQFGMGQRGESTIKVDVEAVFRVLELLEHRDQWELAPFVASWNEPRRIEAPFADTEVSRVLGEAIFKGQGWGVSQALRRAVFGPGMPYKLTRARMLDALRDIVWLDDAARVVYLRPLIEAAERSGNVTIATLNYDNTLELAASNIGVQIHQGFVAGETGTSPSFPADGTRLYKLHGSIDWEEEREGFGIETIQIRRNDDPRTVEWKSFEGYRPALVFGAGNKLTMAGPYLDLLALFRADLMKANRLTIIGYSFRDDHVNYLIGQWLHSLESSIIRIVEPNWTDHGGWISHQPFLSGIRALASERPDRVIVIPEMASTAIETLEFGAAASAT